MSHNVLVSGALDYLGGTVLARWMAASLPPAYNTLYALVHSDEEADAVKQYGAEPLVLDLADLESVAGSIAAKQITIICFLVDVFNAKAQRVMIDALKRVKHTTGREVHFLHNAGAKVLSSHVEVCDEPLLDSKPRLSEIQKTSSPHGRFTRITGANMKAIEIADTNGVRSYTIAPGLVYGEGEGIGVRVSSQEVAIVQTASAARRFSKADIHGPVSPVCHVTDAASLCLHILRNILQGSEIGYGRDGLYLAASGNIALGEVYKAFAGVLAKRGLIDNVKVEVAKLAPEQEAEGLDLEKVQTDLSRCKYMAKHGCEIGWTPQYPVEHILEVADAEVELALDALEDEAEAAMQQSHFEELMRWAKIAGMVIAGEIVTLASISARQSLGF
ncbi:hypothetical protein BDW62DRAFT_214791 [Aspergillus aurantiobrunneus]